MIVKAKHKTAVPHPSPSKRCKFSVRSIKIGLSFGVGALKDSFAVFCFVFMNI